jgi:hypothetical protein
MKKIDTFVLIFINYRLLLPVITDYPHKSADISPSATVQKHRCAGSSFTDAFLPHHRINRLEVKVR